MDSPEKMTDEGSGGAGKHGLARLMDKVRKSPHLTEEELLTKKARIVCGVVGSSLTLMSAWVFLSIKSANGSIVFLLVGAVFLMMSITGYMFQGGNLGKDGPAFHFSPLKKPLNQAEDVAAEVTKLLSTPVKPSGQGTLFSSDDEELGYQDQVKAVLKKAGGEVFGAPPGWKLHMDGQTIRVSVKAHWDFNDLLLLKTARELQACQDKGTSNGADKLAGVRVGLLMITADPIPDSLHYRGSPVEIVRWRSSSDDETVRAAVARVKTRNTIR